jgi:hypothetical protein
VDTNSPFQFNKCAEFFIGMDDGQQQTPSSMALHGLGNPPGNETTAQVMQMIYNFALKMPKVLTTRASRNVRIDAKGWRGRGFRDC